jgi:hypothetical protein
MSSHLATPGKTPARAAQTPSDAPTGGSACSGGCCYYRAFNAIALLTLLALLGGLYFKGNLNKRTGLISIGGFASVALILFICQKIRAPAKCAVKDKTD